MALFEEIMLLSEFRAELGRAREAHPLWPKDPVRQVAIMVEEAGEALQAVLDWQVCGGPRGPKDLRKELVQTGAMALRCLITLDAAMEQKERDDG